jgi:UrcA family protein
VRVSARGLNLGASADAQTMIKRLDNAAMQACGASRFSLSEVRRATRGGDCYKAAMDSAVTTLGAPVVSSLYHNDSRAFAAR